MEGSPPCQTLHTSTYYKTRYPAARWQLSPTSSWHHVHIPHVSVVAGAQRSTVCRHARCEAVAEDMYTSVEAETGARSGSHTKLR